MTNRIWRVAGVLAIALAGMAAHAAPEPTVVWETGEFEMTKVGSDGNSYSFSDFGGLSVNDDGNLVVDTANAQGAIINLPDTSKTAVSVLIKYSNLAAESGSYATLANCAVNSGNTTYYLGVRTITSGTLPLTAYYAGSAYPFDNATYGHGNVPSMDTGSGYFLFAHGSSNGTYAYSGETIGALDGGYNTQLKWGGYNITKVSIGGGFENGRAYCWKGSGTVIERVAIFLGSVKTPSDLADYYFPSAVAKSYEKWEYAKGMVTWNTTANSNNELAGSNSQYTLFDLQSGVDTSTTYGGTSTCQIFDSTKSATFWNYLSNGSVSDGVYQAPGVALRFAGTSATKTIGGTFGPVTLGGMYVERGAEGYSFQQAGHSRRSTILGSANSDDETWFKFEEPFEVRRTGTLCLSGNINIELPEATDVLTLNANADNGNANYAPNVVATVTGLSNNGNVYIGTHTTAGGTLRMHGAGHIAAAKLVASGATLDFSDIGSRYNDATPFINCPLTIDGDTKFVFPEDIVLPYTYKVATSITYTGTLAAEYTDDNGNVYTLPLTIDTVNGTVTVPALTSATVIEVNGALTISAATTADIVVNSTGVLTLATGGSLSGTVTGSGTIVCNQGVDLSGSGFDDSTNWTGKVQLTGDAVHTTDFNETVYGNANSTLEVVSGHVYMTAVTSLPGTVNVANGATLYVANTGLTSLSISGTNSGTINLQTATSLATLTLSDGIARGSLAYPNSLTTLNVALTETIADDGEVSFTCGSATLTSGTLTLTRASGTTETPISGTIDGATVSFAWTPAVSGKACWIDYEMEYESGNASKTGWENSGTDTTKLHIDSSIGGSDAFDQDTGMLYTYAHPYRSDISPYPDTWTAVVRCTVPNYPDAAVITFGWNSSCIGLIAGETPNTEMRLVQSPDGNHYVTNAIMTVQNATTAQHVYVFSVETNQTIKVYCDGTQVLDKTFEAPFSITGGFQIGSILGGKGSTGIVRFAKGEAPANTLSETVQKEARIDCVRLYKGALGPNAIHQLSVEFPAVKLFEATISGGENGWNELSWTGGDISTLDQYSKIILTVNDDAKLTLPSQIVAEDFSIDVADGKTLEMVGSNTELTTTNPIEVNDGAVKLTGTLAANAEITGKLAIEGLTLTGSGALTVAGTITATEAVALQEEASIVVKSGATVNVTSGEFTAVATTFELGSKTMATDNGNGTYTFEAAWAQIGESANNRFASRDAAKAAFTDHNSVMTVLHDGWEDDGAWEADGIMWNETARQYYYAAVRDGGNNYATVAAAIAAGVNPIVLNKNLTEDITLPQDTKFKPGSYTYGTLSAASGCVIGRKTVDGEEVYEAITNNESIWIGGDHGDWNLYSNWSTGAVPGTNTVVTILEDPEDACTIGISHYYDDYDHEEDACAAIIANGTVTFTYTGEGDHYPELTLYGGISGEGKVIIKCAGLRNVSGGTITIACAFGVEYNHTTNDSFLRGGNFNITGDIEVNGYLKIEDGTAVNASGVTVLRDRSKIQARNNATATIAELTAADGVSAIAEAESTGTLTVEKLTGAGDLTVNNGTITLLDNYTGTLGGTLSIGTVNAATIDQESPLVKLADGCTVNNIADILVTKDGASTDYRLYRGDDGLYVMMAVVVFRSKNSGKWMDENSWTNRLGEALTEWPAEQLIYANIDADMVDSVTIDAGDSFAMSKLTITGSGASQVELAINGEIAIDQKLDLSGMAGTIVKGGSGVLVAKGDNSAAELNWTVNAGTLSLGGEFDSIGGNDTVVTMTGGTLDIAGAHGGSTVKKLVINGDGAVFTNSAVVDEIYVYAQTFPFPQIEVNANGIVCSDIDGERNLEWGAKAAGGAPSWITIAEGKTLTKTGAGKFYINNMAITGEGTLKVFEGALDKGGNCTVDNLEIENWSNIVGGGYITVNKLLTINNAKDSTVQLELPWQMYLGENAKVRLKNTGTLNVGTWRGTNQNQLILPEEGGKLQIQLASWDEIYINLKATGVDNTEVELTPVSGSEWMYGSETITCEDGIVHVERSFDCMVTNPVTGEKKAVDYRFFGGELGEETDWSMVGNWSYRLDTYTSWGTLTGDYAPAVTGSNMFDPILVDARTATLSSGTADGWTFRLAAMHSANVTIDHITKLQWDGNPMWIMADATSKVTFNGWEGEATSGKLEGTIKYYVTGDEGITFNMPFVNSASTEFTAEYYLAGAGSVYYQQGISSGIHQIKQATIEMGDDSWTWKAIKRKALVKYSEKAAELTFDWSELKVSADTEGVEPEYKSGVLYGTEEWGTYTVKPGADGLYLEYIGRSETDPASGGFLISGGGSQNWFSGESVPGESATVTIRLEGDMKLNLGSSDITIDRLLILSEGPNTLEFEGSAKLTANVIAISKEPTVRLTVADKLAGTLNGEGVISYVGVLPSGAINFTDGDWAGVLWLQNCSCNGTDVSGLASENSVLRLTGVSAYFAAAKTCKGALELQDDGDTPALTLTDGWSTANPTVFGKLLGTGTLTASKTTVSQLYVFKDASEFKGSINMRGKIFRIILGNGESLNPENGTITIAEGANVTIVSGKTWTVSGGLVNYGTLYLYGTLDGELTNYGTLYTKSSGATASRTLNAGANENNQWKGTAKKTWECDDLGYLPPENSDVTITTAGENAQRLAIVLSETNVIHDLTIDGTQPLKIMKSLGGADVEIVGGTVSNNVPLTIEYGALDLSKSHVILGENGSITFDISKWLKSATTNSVLKLTGECDNYEEGRITFVPNPDTVQHPLIRFKEFKYDTKSKTYLITTEYNRTAKDVYIEVVDGASEEVEMYDEVYYFDGDAKVYSKLMSGDTLIITNTTVITDSTLVITQAMDVARYVIPKGVTLDFTSVGSGTIPFWGEGTVMMTNARPSVTTTAVANALTDPSKWTGTLMIEHHNFNNAGFDNLGNEKSELVLTGCSVTPSSGWTATVPITLSNKFSGTNWGWGLDFHGISGSDGQTATINKLKGDGKLMNSSGSINNYLSYLKIVDASEFTGGIENVLNADGKGVAITIGDETRTDGGTVSFKVAAGARLPVHKSITTTKGIQIDGTIAAYGAGVTVAGENAVFAGTVEIAEQGAYPVFDTDASGTVAVKLAAGVTAKDGMTLFRVTGTDTITSVTCTASGFKVAKTPGTGYTEYKLKRTGFYIRIR